MFLLTILKANDLIIMELLIVLFQTLLVVTTIFTPITFKFDP